MKQVTQQRVSRVKRDKSVGVRTKAVKKGEGTKRLKRRLKKRLKKKRKREFAISTQPSWVLFTKGPRKSCICDNMDGHDEAIMLSEIMNRER